MKKEDKKDTRKLKLIIIITILLILFIFGVLTIYNINKTKIFKETVNNLSANLIEGLNNKNIDFLNIDSPTRFDFTVSMENDLNDKIFLRLDTDNKNNKLGLEASYNSLYDINLYQDSDNVYLKSNTLLDNIYKLNLKLDSSCEVNCDTTLNDYIKSLTSGFTFNTDNLKDLINMLNKTINKSLKSRYVTITKEQNTNNGDKKYTYKLNKDSIKVLIDSIDKNTELKNELFDFWGNYLKKYNITVDNFKEIYKNINDEGTFNVYEQSGMISLISIDWEDFLNLSVRPDGDKVNITVNWDFIASEFKISIDKTNQEYVINIYNLGELIYDINISKKNMLIIDIKLYDNGITYPITFINKVNKNESITNGLVTLQYKDTIYDINYKIEKNVTIDDKNFNSALTINNIEEIDMSKINSALEIIGESNLIKSLLEIIQELSF